MRHILTSILQISVRASLTILPLLVCCFIKVIPSQILVPRLRYLEDLIDLIILSNSCRFASGFPVWSNAGQNRIIYVTTVQIFYY